MAIKERKTTYIKRKKPAVNVDRDLMDALNAGRRTYSYTPGSIIPVMKPLVIDRSFGRSARAAKKNKPSEDTYSYETVSERTHSYAAEHMSPEMTEEQKKKVKKLTKRKLFESVMTIGLIVLSGLFVMMLLFPQTELSELSRDNSNLKDSINTVKRKILDAEENANGITDMDAIRAQALQLGMQDPNQNQVVNLPIPNNDSLKTVIPYDTYGINEDVLRANQDALEEYYATHPGR
jgi:cell division protein FtsL